MAPPIIMYRKKSHEDIEGINTVLRVEAPETLDLLRNLNQAQALQHNLTALVEVGGATVLAEQKLHSSIEDGIDLDTVAARREYYGPNALPKFEDNLSLKISYHLDLGI